jgi:hypothetical protein
MQSHGKRPARAAAGVTWWTAMAIATGIGGICGGLPARAADTGCKPATDALARMVHTPVHVYTTVTGAAFTGGKPMSTESIYVGGAIYVRINGAWRHSALGVADVEKQQQKNEREAQELRCRYLRDETVNGEIAAVYSLHQLAAGATVDSSTWISKATGLPLRTEADMDVGGKLGKSHQSTRYEYRGVAAPAVK